MAKGHKIYTEALAEKLLHLFVTPSGITEPWVKADLLNWENKILLTPFIVTLLFFPGNNPKQYPAKHVTMMISENESKVRQLYFSAFATTSEGDFWSEIEYLQTPMSIHS